MLESRKSLKIPSKFKIIITQFLFDQLLIYCSLQQLELLKKKRFESENEPSI